MSVVFEHPLKVLSAFVCVLVLIGLLKRTRRRIHITMMVSALVIDLWIVLYLEIRRGVVESVPGREPTTLLIVHIALSVTVLVLYGVQLYTGIRKKLKGLPSLTHKRAAIAFVITRFGNLITSILVMQE